ncbi:MAG: hypothetical protein DMG76_33835, partial [Acidobacteria bacterium]
MTNFFSFNASVSAVDLPFLLQSALTRFTGGLDVWQFFRLSKLEIVLVLCGLLGGAIAAEAQSGTTAVVGDVTDPQDRPVSGAKVTVTDSASAVTRET